MRGIVYIAALAALGLSICVVISLVTGPDASAETDAQVVYLCRETQELIRGRPQPTPAVNPETGRPTLYRALYCAKCEKWQAVAPSEVYGGNPLSTVCPRHREPMSPEGPLPGEAPAR
ncbi:MAG TPA: hypothetical protein VML55_13285 [Planctomycetaceae bacterium]|nr:hypothetical protein [Planctomycetaceae bacterium]